MIVVSIYLDISNGIIFLQPMKMLQVSQKKNIYKREVGLDLYKSYVPLEDPVVRVLTTEDLGEITFSSIGIIRLKKDSLHLLLRDDVEPFIQSGKLILF